MKEPINIAFGMIVLNGEPFLRYNLRSLYPFARQIIVVEGACPSAAAVATTAGHSTDGTLEVLHDFKHLEDPENKISIVTAGDEGYTNGFWPGKTEMSQAYARRAKGNYLWQVDSDEFYHEEQIKRLIGMLERERPDAVSFPMITFWGGLGYITDSFYLIRDNAREYHRLFAWGSGYFYKTHFPPTVVDAQGVDLRRKRWLRARDLEKQNMLLYHYSLLLPLQVFNKVSYYKTRNRSTIDSWEESVYRRLEKPFRAHNVYCHISWLERFTGDHPAVIQLMMRDIKGKEINVELRDCKDVERLLSKKSYLSAVKILRTCSRLMAHQPFNLLYRVYASAKYRLKKFFRPLPSHVGSDT
jgi:hypothetical protein